MILSGYIRGYLRLSVFICGLFFAKLAAAGETPAAHSATIPFAGETPALADAPGDSSQGKGFQAAIPSRSWLPLVVQKAPRLAETSKQQPLRLRASADLPAPAFQPTDPASRPSLEPSGPPARAAAPDAARLARPWRETSPDPDRASMTADPVQDQVLRVTLAISPELRQRPAPYLHLAIPDPLSPSGVVRLQKEPPDNDPPVAVTDRPLRPVLPTRSPTAPKP